jgi:hypothetical protein
MLQKVQRLCKIEKYETMIMRSDGNSGRGSGQGTISAFVWKY